MRALFKNAAITVSTILLICAPYIASWLGEPFYLDVLRRIMIMSVAALSLYLLVFHAGMTSFGHAVYLGIGSYSVALFGFFGVNDGVTHFLGAVLASGLFAFVVGCIVVRVTGTYFIMITLAFAQLVFFLLVGMKKFGGDDGIMLKARSQFDWLDLRDDTAFYYLVFLVLVVSMLGAHRLIHSKFGRVLNGIRQNERRMESFGYNTKSYKITIFTIAGVMCGIAGALLANHSDFASPDAMHWSRSGDLLVIVVIGGMSSVFGPLFGVSVFILMELILSGWSKQWHLVFGPALVIYAIVFGPGGAVCQWRLRRCAVIGPVGSRGDAEART